LIRVNSGFYLQQINIKQVARDTDLESTRTKTGFMRSFLEKPLLIKSQVI
jgi:hypothetical protein